jgi:exonuclease SbcC
LIRRRNDVEDNKKIVEQNRATNQIILDGLQFDALENSNKVTDLESIEKFGQLTLHDEKKKKADVIF